MTVWKLTHLDSMKSQYYTFLNELCDQNNLVYASVKNKISKERLKAKSKIPTYFLFGDKRLEEIEIIK